jgi:DNA/RNA endonuclease G (NUC1)
VVCSSFSADAKNTKTWGCGLHTSKGLPATSDNLLCRRTHAIGYNYEHKAPEWTAFYLNSYYVSLDLGFTPKKITADSSVDSGKRPRLSRYSSTPYVAASLLPITAIDVDSYSLQQATLQTSTAPMMDSFYDKIWDKLLLSFNHWTIDYEGDVIGYTGAIYTPNGDEEKPYDHSQTINANIPNYFYVIAYNITSHESIAFLLPHDNIKFIDIDKYRVSIDQIESLSGLDFIALEDDIIESEVESKVNHKWGLSSVVEIK